VAFTSLTFIGFITLTALLTSLFSSPSGRAAVLLAANVVFIGSYVDSVMQVVPLAAFLLLCYAIIEGVRRGRSSLGLCMGLGVIVVTFIVLKKFSFLSAVLVLPFPYLIAGLSYILFRALHLTVDAKQGELNERIGALDFFNYTCNFLTFTAGPIQRFQDYASARQKPLMLDADTVFGAFARVVKGYVKVGVVSAIFKYLFDTASTRLLDDTLAVPWPMLCGLYVAAAVFYTVYLYANFAGYMDIVIGVGKLMGQEVPENFNLPFLARSFLDFWSRWHMTLSEWFKTYVFNPLLKAMAVRITSAKAGPYLGVVAFFNTFLIMGVWHGTTSVFVVYGLLMGAGASINKLWQVMITKRLGKKRYKMLSEKTLSIYFARGLTLSYFALAVTCLWVDMPQLLRLTHQLGVHGLLLCYFGLAVAGGVVYLAWDTLMALLQPLSAGLGRASSGVVGRNLALGAQVVLIVTVASFFHKAPEFVYRAF
jgi:D-alanyl-lipoteichoic acid acyltransferase DltB (MBOAT superfamily)